MRRKARDGLFAAFAQYLWQNFNAAERYLADFKELCGKDSARLSAYYLLLGKGRAKQGKHAAAVKAYLHLFDLNAGHYLIELPAETGLPAESPLWFREHVKPLLPKVPAEQRKQLEQEVERRLKKAPSLDVSPRGDKARGGVEAFFLRGPAVLVTLPETLFEKALALANMNDSDWRVSYLLAVGRGREQQGKYVEAARAYLDFYELRADRTMMTVPGEHGLRVAPLWWLRGHLDALFCQAPAEQRKQIQQEVERRRKKWGSVSGSVRRR